MARTNISLRLAPVALKAVDDLALEYQVHRSDVIRIALGIVFEKPTELRRRLAEARTRL